MQSSSIDYACHAALCFSAVATRHLTIRGVAPRYVECRQGTVLLAVLTVPACACIDGDVLLQEQKPIIWASQYDKYVREQKQNGKK